MPHDEQTSDRKNMIGSVAWPVALHAVVPLFWLGVVSHAIPRFQVAYDQFGLELPGSTRTVLQFSNLVSHYPHIYLLMLVFFLAADAVIYYGALRSGGRIVACSWSIFVLLVQAVLTILTLLAACFPIRTMISKMSI